MDMIYSRATKTLIWLSEETLKVKDAIPALERFQETSRHTSLTNDIFKNDHAPDIHGLHDRFYELCGDKKAETMAQIASFFQRPRFSRSGSSKESLGVRHFRLKGVESGINIYAIKDGL